MNLENESVETLVEEEIISKDEYEANKAFIENADEFADEE